MSRAIFHKIGVAICLTSLLSVCTGSFTKQVLANDSNTESRDGLPGRRVGGGTRGGSEPIVASTIVVLAPESSEGYTTLENPTLFFYVPKTANQTKVEFVLSDESGEPVYEKTIALDGNAGVVEIGISADDKIKSLQINQNYRWYFGNKDISVTGWIKRVPASAELVSKVKDLAPLDRVGVYASNNFWVDAVAIVGELRRSRPNDPAVQARWKELLQSVKLDEISQQPFLNYQILSQQPTVVGSEPQ